MSLLSAIPVGVLAGFLLGGRLSNLERLRLRWWALVVSALAIQVAIFTALVPLPSRAIPFLYLLSNSLACAWLVRNIRVGGVPCIGVGSLSNLAAITLNGGRMPVDRALLVHSRGAAFAQGSPPGCVARSWRRMRPLSPGPPNRPAATKFPVADFVIEGCQPAPWRRPSFRSCSRR